MPLTAEGVTFTYRRGREAVISDFGHEFDDGTVTALTGASGRGKSTLLYILGLLLRPQSGTITVGGISTDSLKDAGRATVRAGHIGFVFQDAALDPSRTILDAVIEPARYAGVPRSERTTRAVELLDELGLAERADHRPGEISGGQAQRVAVARALVNKPTVVLADEPTGNLDRGNAETVLAALRAASTDRTIVIATHDPFVLEHVDHVVEL